MNASTMLTFSRNGVSAGLAALLLLTAAPASAGPMPVSAARDLASNAPLTMNAVATPGEANLIEVKTTRKRTVRRGNNNAAAAAIIGGIAALGIGAAVASRNSRRYDDGYYNDQGYYGQQPYYAQPGYRSSYYDNRGYGYAQPQPTYRGRAYAQPQPTYRGGGYYRQRPQQVLPNGQTMPSGVCYIPPERGGPSYGRC